MSRKSRTTYKRIKRELEEMVPDHELQSNREGAYRLKQEEREEQPGFGEKLRRMAKNTALVIFTAILALLWLNDWSVSRLSMQASNLARGIFGGQPVFVQNGPIAPTLPEIPPLPPLPELSDLPERIEEQVRTQIQQDAAVQAEGMAEYLSEMRGAGYGDRFDIPALTAFYRVGVEVAYLDQLNEDGLLDQFSFPAILAFYSTEVSPEYLMELREEGYLEQFDFPAIVAFYSNDLPVSYLDGLRQQGELEGLSFTDILLMYQAE